MAFKRYSKKEPIVFVWVIIPYIFFMNLLIFGGCIFNSATLFLKAFLYSGIYFFLIYGIFGTVAVFIQKRLPASGDLFRRIFIMLPVFYFLNIAAVSIAFYIFNHTDFLSCKPVHDTLGYTILYACVMSTLITFINEGMANWEQWKSSLSETEKLKNSYQRSKLLGLKGQINPHFLFNCFNTLSGLIADNETKAEKFLNEMTKVHRYMLRSDDEYLVPLSDEMKFANSYLYLTKSRFGDAINVDIDVNENVLEKLIPPLSMQVILENIIYTNALNKKDPLQIQISAKQPDELHITHSLHEKVIVNNFNLDEGLDNLVTKYRLLRDVELRIEEEATKRIIILPLL